MKNYKILLSKKEYVLLIIKADTEKEAISKAYNNEFVEAIHNPESLPDSDYKIEKIVEKNNNN